MNTAPVRVRFAPSPTGYLHVGGLRTALYNFLFARAHGGTMVLRIEDTDRGRYVEGAVENLLTTLAWAGIDVDEGPAQGGQHGPYVQSERTALYREHVELLLAQDKAYRCFCSPEQLDAARARQLAEGRDAAYDRSCRALGKDEVEARLRDGLPYTVRLKVPLSGSLRFDDVIRGDITVMHEVIDDQVLLKSDGFPTYHLANVVDDHFMAITHVIRGEEWLPSTAKHVLLYEAFGWQPPVFAHLPLLLNADRSKLSKRQGDVAVEDYRAKGFLPEALVNFVALLGWNPGDDRELFTLGELCDAFSLERVSKAGAVFDLEKLRWFNAQYLRTQPAERLLELCAPWLREAGIDIADSVRTHTLLELLASYLTVPADIAAQLAPFAPGPVAPEDDEAKEALSAESAYVVLRALLPRLMNVEPWSAERIKEMINEVKSECGVKGKALFMPVRVALTGRAHGPELGMVAELIGRELCVRRLNDAVA